jgi:hypothetical protein
MSPIIQTMKNQQPTHTRGGARPNSGPKPNIEKNLILYDIALTFNVGLDRARRLLSEWDNRPEFVIGEKRCRKLRKFAPRENAHEYLAVIRYKYLERREALGLKP